MFRGFQKYSLAFGYVDKELCLLSPSIRTRKAKEET